MTIPFNLCDIIIITLLCMSAAVGYSHGFVRELVSLVAWVGAALLTFYILSHSLHFTKEAILHELGLHEATVVCLYLAILLAFIFIKNLLLQRLRYRLYFGIPDNLMGLALGFSRGIFILTLSILALAVFLAQHHPPEWVRTMVDESYLWNHTSHQ
jgi:membrane protein required for colicin V production